MQPIVNGLEAEYSGQMAFETVDANTAVGQTRLRAFDLRGHPSYVIVSVEGMRLWSSSGQMSDRDLRNQITEYLN